MSTDQEYKDVMDPQAPSMTAEMIGILAKLFGGHIGTGNTKNAYKKNGRRIHGGQGDRVVKAIDPRKLNAKTKANMRANGKRRVTRNSRCPCGSGRRFSTGRCRIDNRDARYEG